MKIVAFNGSPRAGGNTAQLLDLVLRTVKAEDGGADIETELVELGPKPLSGCIACYKCHERKNRRCAVESDPLNDYIDRMLAADAVLLGSPTYFADLTTNMKSLIDRAGMVARANGYMFKRKVGASVATASRRGAIHTYDSMNHFFLNAQMLVPGSNNWNLGFGLAPGEVNEDSEALETMETLGRNLLWLLRRVA